MSKFIHPNISKILRENEKENTTQPKNDLQRYNRDYTAFMKKEWKGCGPKPSTLVQGLSILKGKKNMKKHIYESPDKGKTIYRREFGNYDKRELIKQDNMEMMSLYDYLGRAAGPELGQKVATAAAAAGVKGSMREVSNPAYKGPVMLYPKAFLDLYFKGGLNENTSGKQLLKG
jgi:hypothetical protein